MAPVSKLLLAPNNLSDCLFGAIHRDTFGANLSAADRLSHFPASPMVCVSLAQKGQLFLVSKACGRDPFEPLPSCSIFPPSDAPLTSWSPGGIRATTIAFFPDAWFDLGGSAHFDSVPQQIEHALTVFQNEDDPETGWRAFCTELGTTWQTRNSTGAASVSNWARGLVIRAALSGRGQSLRALERRLKRFSGHTKRTLDFFSAFENLHRIAHQNPDSPIAEIAYQAGYSDQSHLGRTLRRATGFSPAQLNQKIKTKEAFWCYRLLGERF